MIQNDTYRQTHTVTAEETAARVASGLLEVYSTPMMIALMENTALKALRQSLTEGEDSVGANICVQHLRPSLVGETLLCLARIVHREGRMVDFEIEVTNEKEETVGKATHTRAIIDPVRFMAKLTSK